ncbi:SOS response-associated peptidase [Haloparvum sp. PAK95]|uniref:SOS response-associated peptidase n=1 Tax=Haloparvum sp. PAK95 TaxID=3418962 RepID=UPI003D2EA2A9
MCGRYSLFTGTDELEARFDADFRSHEPTYNCAPGEELPVITSESPDEARRLEWGLTPSWADERHGHINARAETVDEKPAFEAAYESHRCLVPADGFYEWVEQEGSKQPYRVAFEDDRPFAMAGLYERWTPPTTQTGLGDFGGGASTDEEPVESFTILTTEPNDLVADLHHRMAVILDPETEETWLHGTPEEAAELLEPYPATAMTAYPVSTRVNAAGNDGPELIEPV